eukprot:TRINITY_DN5419_c0_g2_i1.p1 TRINITY_DN5419_c0_g2~~TRINITY_DN5419_c0_g2_i1.p1  ORF type:complete len:490 (+),score=116.22 TRINITY_DN5419_c0_g2_i1:64-1533(+)
MCAAFTKAQGLHHRDGFAGRNLLQNEQTASTGPAHRTQQHMAQGPPPPPGPPGSSGIHQQQQQSSYYHGYHPPPQYFGAPMQHEGFGMEGGEIHGGAVPHNGYGLPHDGSWLPGAEPAIDPHELIIDVWADQLEAAFEQIRQIVVHYPYVAMDTEFPGVVARPVGSFRSNAEFYYQTLRCNVNLLKIIQLGITFSDAEGRHPPGACTWQFNFKFNLTDDIYAQDSIDLLASSGLDFERFASQGIDVNHFAELLISSGLVFNAYGVDTQVQWLSFHSGYDFGYLVKILTNKELPSEEEEFFELMQGYFPEVFDVKYLLKQTGGALSDMCGLNKLGEDLAVDRIGPAHQAGSDSLLTCHCFFKLCRQFFTDVDSLSKHGSTLYGLGQDRGDCGGRDFQGSRSQQNEQQQQQQQASNGWGAGTPTSYQQQSPQFPNSPLTPTGGHGLTTGGGGHHQPPQHSYIQHVVYRGTSAPTSIRNIQPGHHYDGIGGT